MKNPLLVSLAALVAALIAGCTAVGPNYQKPTVPGPAAYKNQPPASERSTTKPPLAWWRVFDDPALDELEASAVTANRQLASAVARVDEARARLGLARGDTRPSVTTT